MGFRFQRDESPPWQSRGSIWELEQETERMTSNRCESLNLQSPPPVGHASVSKAAALKPLKQHHLLGLSIQMPETMRHISLCHHGGHRNASKLWAALDKIWRQGPDVSKPPADCHTTHEHWVLLLRGVQLPTAPSHMA